MTSEADNRLDRRDTVVRGHPTLTEAFWVWTRIALLSFGGPAGQIALMHRILIDEKRWISESRFLHALNYCMLLPGPEAQQLATYIGWLMHRTLGGLMAGLLFILPGFLSILALSILYAGFQDWRPVQGLFYGLKPAVLALVLAALIKLGSRVLKNRIMFSIAGAAFVAIFFFRMPFPLVVFLAAATGLIGASFLPEAFSVIRGHRTIGSETEVDSTEGSLVVHPRSRLAQTFFVLVIWLTIWFLPVLGLLAIGGSESVYFQQATFFSKAAVVTFGGAYSVMAYIAQEGVYTYGWLEPGQMLDGMGMAESTPGPLIQVVQFVGFMGAYREPGPLSPLTAGIAGSVITTWVTFAPCFLWIFGGAPYIEGMRTYERLNAAMSAITASVVGVILNLSIWFSLNTVFGSVNEYLFWGATLPIPDWSSIDLAVPIIAIGALIALIRSKAGLLTILAVSAFTGLCWYLVKTKVGNVS